jgi:cysteine desulfurase
MQAAPLRLKRPIYLDYQATTPCDPRVVEAMAPYLETYFGNPHSRTHVYGWEAEEAVEKARTQIAQLINTAPKDVIFTSGATESNNLAVKGVAGFWKGGPKKHIITSRIEHKCLLESCRQLEQEGFRVTYLPVTKNGLIDLELLEKEVTTETLLVSIIAVSNEIGVIQPLKDIGAICRAKGAYFHTDAAQAVGKIPIDVDAMHIDLLSISGHKLYGPKGIGALYVRRKNPRVRLKALMSGGGQERGMRSGTLPTPLCVGLGAACKVAQQDMDKDYQKAQHLYQLFYTYITKNVPEVYLNGDATSRIPHNVNISFSCVEGEGLMMGIKDLALSSGSACTSASLEPSYVLKALGVSEELAHTSLRVSFGRMTTEEEALYAAKRIATEVTRLRSMSPLWEMQQEGIDISSIQWAAH